MNTLRETVFEIRDNLEEINQWNEVLLSARRLVNAMKETEGFIPDQESVNLQILMISDIKKERLIYVNNWRLFTMTINSLCLKLQTSYTILMNAIGETV